VCVKLYHDIQTKYLASFSNDGHSKIVSVYKKNDVGRKSTYFLERIGVYILYNYNSYVPFDFMILPAGCRA